MASEMKENTADLAASMVTQSVLLTLRAHLVQFDFWLAVLNKAAIVKMSHADPIAIP